MIHGQKGCEIARPARPIECHYPRLSEGQLGDSDHEPLYPSTTLIVKKH